MNGLTAHATRHSMPALTERNAWVGAPFRWTFLVASLVLVINLEILLGIANANPIEKLLLFAAGLLFIATRPRLHANIVLTISICMIALTCAVLTTFDGFSWNRFARSLVSLLSFLLLLSAVPDSTDQKLVLRVLAFFPCTAVVLGAAYQAIGIGSLFGQDFLGAVRLQGSLGPAFLGAAAFTGAIAACFMSLRYGSVWLLLVAVNVAIALLTASRMAAALTIAIVGIILFLEHRSALFRSILVLYGAAALAGFLLFFGGQLLTRFQSDSMSGRQLIWNDLWFFLDHYPFFGVGLGHQMDIVSERTMQLTRTVAAHNEYLRFAVETGYGGAIAMGTAFLFMLLGLARNDVLRYRWSFLTVCAAFLAFSATDNTFSVAQAFLAVVAAYFGCMTTANSKTEKRN